MGPRGEGIAPTSKPHQGQNRSGTPAPHLGQFTSVLRESVYLRDTVRVWHISLYTPNAFVCFALNLQAKRPREQLCGDHGHRTNTGG